MEEVSFYLSFLVTFSLCFIAMLYARNKYLKKNWKIKKAKNIYSICAFIIAICGGTFLFYALTWFFSLFVGHKPNYGHGVIIIAAALYNFILGLILLSIGRIVVGWK